MRSLVFDRIGHVAVRELPDPAIIDPTDATVQITATTICGSDLHIVGGHMVPDTGFPIGHEWVGVVTAVGAAVDRVRVGQRVTSAPAPWCGTCSTCRRGQTQRCEFGGVLGSGPTMGGFGGAQSTALRVPYADHDLVVIPETVSDEAALAAADVLGTGWTGVAHTHVGAGETIVVIGCGPVGLAAVHTAKHLTGAGQVIAVDPVSSRLDVARELGADIVLSSDEHTAEAVRAATDDWGAETVVDAAGAQVTFDLASDILAVGGRVAVLGIAAAPLAVDFFGLLNKNASLWTGLGELWHLETMMRHLANGLLDPSPMFTHRASLDELPEYYERLAARDLDIIKVLARPTQR